MKDFDFAQLWHLLLGYSVPLKSVRGYIRDRLFPHVNCKPVQFNVCTKGKFRKRFAGSLIETKGIGVINVDTKGIIKTRSVNC